MHFMAVEVERQLYLCLPTTNLRPAGLDESSTDEPPFRMNFLHDLESLWWAAIWVLFHHTGANSPTESPDAQLSYFNEAFPRAIAQVSCRDFFTMSGILYKAYKTLSTTYRDKCYPVIALADILRESMRRRRNHFPFSHSMIISLRKYTNKCYMLTMLLQRS